MSETPRERFVENMREINLSFLHLSITAHKPLLRNIVGAFADATFMFKDNPSKEIQRQRTILFHDCGLEERISKEDEAKEEYDCPVHGKLGSSECPRC